MRRSVIMVFSWLILLDGRWYVVTDVAAATGLWKAVVVVAVTLFCLVEEGPLRPAVTQDYTSFELAIKTHEKHTLNGSQTVSS